MSKVFDLQQMWRSPSMSSEAQKRIARRVGAVQAATRFLPPPLLLLLSILSVQLGAAIAKSLFHLLGSGGTVFLRVGLAAMIYMIMARPRLRGYSWCEYGWVVLFGLVIAGMNSLYYASISRIPLGVATTYFVIASSILFESKNSSLPVGVYQKGIVGNQGWN
jgi:hypothetical protein